MKYMYPQIDWDSIRIVGFDMDGTLYDERDFIEQVYVPISEYLANICKGNTREIYKKMLDRWTEKGSSYPYIFSEILEEYNVQESGDNRIVAQCLTLFRSFNPNLTLSREVTLILEEFYRKYRLFLITDGHEELQAKKLLSMGLNNFFDSANIGISGVYGKGYQKPSTQIIRAIQVLDSVNAEQVVFFGDRHVDEQFAKSAGFHFIKVKCMRSEAGSWTDERFLG